MSDWNERLDRIEEMLDRHSRMMTDADLRHQAAREEHETWLKTADERHDAWRKEHEAWMRDHDARMDRHDRKLDQIGALMNRQLLAAEEHHAEFAAEHKKLLAAMAITDAQVSKTSAAVDRLIVKLDGLIEKLDRFNGLGPAIS